MSSAEFSLIEWIRNRQQPHPRLPVGIGDDGAVVAADSKSSVVVTDMLLEGTHFEFPNATPAQAGRKALAVNLSDMAAMGAEPEFAFVSLALPRSGGSELGRQVMTGLQELADEFSVVVAGGDTTSWNGALAINVTVTGRATSPVFRSGTQVGDWILVTGELGGSIFQHHLTFTPRLRESAWLRENAALTSMIDLSDGLSSDIGHVAKASQVGVRLMAESIPVSDRVLKYDINSEPSKAIDHALNDGEDFELLLTCSERDARVLLAATSHDSAMANCRLTHIGHVVQDCDCLELEYSDQSRHPLKPRGFSHDLD